MDIKIKLALKYLSGKNRYFLSFSNLIAFLGIIIGLFSLIVVSSVMNGLSKDMARRIVSTKGEVRIFNKDFSSIENYQELIEELEAKYPLVRVGGPVNRDDLLLRRRVWTAYTETFGIDFTRHQEISDIFNMIVIGNPNETSFKKNGIVLGLDVAHSLVATVGDTVEVISPSIMTPTPFGMIPKTERFKVVGIFAVGLPEFDRLYSFIDIDKSKSYKRQKGVDYIELKTNIKDYNYSKLTQQIETDYPNVSAQHWEIFDKTLFQAIKVEKIALFVVMTIILVLASFNITGNFIRTVTEKKGEIAILKTLGMDKKGVFGFFVMMGLIVCLAGVIIADILAYLLLYWQVKTGFIQIPIPGFPFNAVPVDLNVVNIFLYSLLTLFICLVGTLYPAYKTMKVSIIEVLHSEE
jgi:lipoprotein-releasing system permease protein